MSENYSGRKYHSLAHSVSQSKGSIRSKNSRRKYHSLSDSVAEYVLEIIQDEISLCGALFG